MSKRVFAFGCSFTEYQWPTWADVIGNSLHQQGYEYYNFGNSGSGNYYILNSLYWADKKYKFTDDDILLVLWSSWSREDRYLMDYHWDPELRGQWTKEGNILTSVYSSYNFTEEFLRYWSLENDIIKNISSIDIARKLFNIDFEDSIPAWEQAPQLDENRPSEDLPEAIYQMFIKKSVEAQTDGPWEQVYNKYNFKTEWKPEPYIDIVAQHDGHPVPMAHMDYVKIALPTIRDLETVTEETEKYIKSFTDRMQIYVKERWDNAMLKIKKKHNLEQEKYCAGVYNDLWFDEWPLHLLRTFRPKGK